VCDLENSQSGWSKVEVFEALWRQHDAVQKAAKPPVCRYVFQRHGKRIKDSRGS
jgi:hypothetical protein